MIVPLLYFIIGFCYSTFLFITKRDVVFVLLVGFLWPVALPLHLVGQLDMLDTEDE